MRRFEGKVALVTGAASGIGRATALRLAEEGASVVCADVQADALEGAAKAAAQSGAETLAQICDVSSPEDARDTVAAALARFGRLDVLCNIAGVLHFANTHEHSLEQWERVLAINLTGTFLMSRAAIPALLETRGSIVNISSTAALGGHPWTAAYSASKGGVMALTHTLAIEYGRQGLRVNALAPGAVQTDIQKAFAFPDGVDKSLIQRILPFDGEFRGPESCASVVAFLASEDGAHVNGELIRVDGGMLS